jgi:UPF0755 protein
LEEEGLIRSRVGFVAHVLLKGERQSLKAGVYLLNPSMNMGEIADRIIAGEISSMTIRILEGWDAEKIAAYLEERGIAESKEFLRTVGSKNAEGYLFPDTYQIATGTSAEAIVELMLENFGKRLTPEMEKEIREQGKTVFDIVVMASMIEKEVRQLADKKLVAGILWKRLEQGIPLQVDATVAYLTGEKGTSISKAGMEVDSHYNTYRYLGLPVGPISNPGTESIKAAMYPTESSYLYYLSTIDGITLFSETLEEHNIKKVKYVP